MFLGLLALLVAAGWLARTDGAGWTVCLFVVVGWVVSLCLHELAHAVAALHGGDASVVDKGYLTLDPRRYADPGLSLVFPVLIVLIGGIGLPGGAVWVNRGALRGPWTKSLVSFVGPATNAVCAALCLLPLGLGWVELRLDTLSFSSALAFLGFLQISAVLLNLLPVPGLDGFGVVSPHLPMELRAKLAPLSRWGILVVFVVLLVPEVNRAFFGLVDDLVGLAGVDERLVQEGYRRFRFWER